MSVQPSPSEAAMYRQLFDRSEQYAELRTAWRDANRTLSRLPAAGPRPAAQALAARDRRGSGGRLLPDGGERGGGSGLGRISSSASMRFSSPDEPHETAGRDSPARSCGVPRPNLGDAPPPLGGPGGERLADSPLHRSRGQVSLARQAIGLPEVGARLRFRRRDLHPRRRPRHLRDAAGELRPGRRPCARSPGHDRSRRSMSVASRCPKPAGFEAVMAGARERHRGRRCVARRDEHRARLAVRPLPARWRARQGKRTRIDGLPMERWPLNVSHDAPYTLWQLVRYMLGLGTWGFGGPVALVGYMYRDLVEKRSLDLRERLQGGHGAGAAHARPAGRAARDLPGLRPLPGAAAPRWSGLPSCCRRSSWCWRSAPSTRATAGSAGCRRCSTASARP